MRAAGAAARELDVQPLRDTQVEDLRQKADALVKARKYADAAAALDQALQINADDPALLQERAEAALLLHRLDDAERYAQKAFDGGSQVGRCAAGIGRRSPRRARASSTASTRR